MIDKVRDDYFDGLYDTDRDRVMARIEKALADGISPEDIVFQVVIPTMDKVSKLYIEEEQVSISQQFLASRISEEVVDGLLGRFKTPPQKKGTVVIGTARGDFHGLGKKIVGGYLKAHMFGVRDLGLNVSAESFVDQALEAGARVIGVSSMMLHTAKSEAGPRAVRALLKEHGLEADLKLVVGGAPYLFDENLYSTVEADAWGRDAMDAVRAIGALMEGKAAS